MEAVKALWPRIKHWAEAYGLNPQLVAAFVTVESAGNPGAVRFEPAWHYLYKVELFAGRLGITSDTERTLQAMSWGPMQVMGSVARELGFCGYLHELADVEMGLEFGCAKLALISKTHKTSADIAAAYNGGTAKRGDDGKYANQGYVDKIARAYTELARIVAA